MRATTEQMDKILKFREEKMKELKRTISFSEAVALWLAEVSSQHKIPTKSITIH